MSDLRVQLDPLNPGQFYACCGLLELAGLDRGPVISRFEQETARPRIAWFQMHDVPQEFLGDALNMLRGALSTLFFDPDCEASISPATLQFGNHLLELDWWLDEFRNNKPHPLRCWAGNVTTSKLFEDLLPPIPSNVSGTEVFARSGLTKSKFGVDPRAAWNSLDFGYSPDAHDAKTTVFAAVEILAAVGLQTFRPVVQRKGRTASYNLWTCELPLCVARNAANSPWDGLPHAAYQFSIGSRGQSYKYFRFGEPVNKERSDES